MRPVTQSHETLNTYYDGLRAGFGDGEADSDSETLRPAESKFTIGTLVVDLDGNTLHYSMVVSLGTFVW